MAGNAPAPRRTDLHRDRRAAVGEDGRATTRPAAATSCSSTIAATMVGTPSVIVTPSLAIVSSTTAGSNAGTITCSRVDVEGLEQRHRPRGVEERRHHEIHVIAVERRDGLRVERVGDEVAVREHHALARAGGPARVEESGEVVLARRTLSSKGPVCVAPALDEARRTRRGRCGPHGRRTPRELPGIVVDEQDSAHRSREERVLQLGRRPSGSSAAPATRAAIEIPQ